MVDPGKDVPDTRGKPSASGSTQTTDEKSKNKGSRSSEIDDTDNISDNPPPFGDGIALDVNASDDEFPEEVRWGDQHESSSEGSSSESSSSSSESDTGSSSDSEVEQARLERKMRKNSKMKKNLKAWVHKKVKQKVKKHKTRKQRRRQSNAGTPPNGDSPNHRVPVRAVKSPSDTTLYTPALKRGVMHGGGGGN